VSGFYLIVGILRIRSYFKSKDASDRINNTVLLFHAAAFGLYLVAVFVLALVKALFIFKFEQETSALNPEAFEVVRVTSPMTASSTFLIILGFTYLWTEDGITSFFAAALFSAPYFFLFIRFEPLFTSFFGRIKRNIVLESSVAVLASFVIYKQISALPLLSDQRAETFLIAAAIPGLLHAIYSSICDSAQRQGRIEA
jgi:uncharacterized membrane protein